MKITEDEHPGSPTFLYHGSVIGHLRSIIAKGFVPSHSDKPANWALPQTLMNVTYFSDSEKKARYYAELVGTKWFFRSQGKKFPQPILFRIPFAIAGAVLDDNPAPATDAPLGNDYHTTQHIDAAHIEIKLRDQWVSLREIDEATIQSLDK